jgi:hypothetical protein
MSTTNIFRTSRIRFSELYQDSINFISNTYGNVGQYFTIASPMGQLLQVMLNYGRMILFYIEDSITELNIRTATRPSSVKGLASLTGHNPSRSMAARGTLTLQYNGQPLETYSSTVLIPNYTTLKNQSNGLTYTIVLPGEQIRMDLTNKNNFVDVNILQGTIEYQQATGTGDALQSFNFSSKKGASVDNYYVNVYVNGKQWPKQDSILDMGFDQEGVMIKTGQSGGVDIFFGNGFNGKVPPLGSTILVEYLITDGQSGNLNDQQENAKDQWTFTSTGYALNNEEVDLNKVLKVSVKNSILFGTLDEPLYLTRLLAPRMSRSFVLANANNYIYFLRKLNQYSIIDAIPGFATFDDQYALDKYNQATTRYEQINQEYLNIIATYGEDSQRAKNKKVELDAAKNLQRQAQIVLNEQKKDDNTVYLFLVPDVNKRITPGENYFTCPAPKNPQESSPFRMGEDEKTALLDLIEESGQRVVTVDNPILDIQYPRFVVNMSMLLWEGYEYDSVRQDIVIALSNYFLKNTRRDRIPVSDIVRVVEGIDGVDSVNVWFDADKDNFNIYRTHYGIDDYGDIILERYVKDAWNNNVPVRDIYALFRGDFEGVNGTYYYDGTDKNRLSTVNIQVRGFTPKDLNQENNQAILNNVGSNS